MVGMEAALSKTDSVITSYRDHAAHVARGGTVLEVIGELLGKPVGASKVRMWAGWSAAMHGVSAWLRMGCLPAWGGALAGASCCSAVPPGTGH